MSNKAATAISSKKRNIKYAYSSISGLQPFRDSVPIQFESSLERDFIVQQETNPAVADIESQPFTLNYYTTDGLKRRYTPDFLVTYKTSPWPYRKSALIEVKPNDVLVRKFAEFKPKFLAAINHCKFNECTFHLRDENKIRDQRWKNGMFLRRVRHFNYGEIEPQIIVDTLRLEQFMSIRKLVNKCFKSNNTTYGFNFICSLMHEGKIEYDTNLPINLDTELWPPVYDFHF